MDKIEFDVPRKHIGKKVNAEQEAQIKEMQKAMQAKHVKSGGKGLVPYALAKHEFFEGIGAPADEPVRKERPAADPSKPIKTKKSPLTIEQTKLGITLVLSKDDCKKLGFKMNDVSKDALKEVRRMLKLD
jgi:hypothetical protein